MLVRSSRTAQVDSNMSGHLSGKVALVTDGRIINIGSINAERMPFPGGSVYPLTKGAVAGFTRGHARELAPRGITINNVQSGPVNTEGNPADGPAAGLMLGMRAIDRFGTVEEIGSFVTPDRYMQYFRDLSDAGTTGALTADRTAAIMAHYPTEVSSEDAP